MLTALVVSVNVSSEFTVDIVNRSSEFCHCRHRVYMVLAILFDVKRISSGFGRGLKRTLEELVIYSCLP